MFGRRWEDPLYVKSLLSYHSTINHWDELLDLVDSGQTTDRQQVIALYNGGPPGVIYEFIAVSVFYWMIASCIAEMASAIPSSAGVYHWASITGGKYGRPLGFFAGWYVVPRSHPNARQHGKNGSKREVWANAECV